MRRPTLDPHPFARGGSVAILTVSLMHLCQSWLLYKNPATIHATNMTAIAMSLDFAKLPHSIMAMQLVMTVSSITAMFAAIFRVGWFRLVCFIPQHMILGAMTWGGVLAAYENRYLDGTPMAWPHISADQIGYLALFIIHSSAIGRRCWAPNG